MADSRIIVCSVRTRPSVSDNHPEKMRPPVLPSEVTTSDSVATVAPRPAARVNGTSWLIVIWPDVVPRQNATHSA